MLVSAKALNGQMEQVELVLPCDVEIKIKNTFNLPRCVAYRTKKEEFLTNCDGYFTIQGKKGKIALKRLKL